MRLVAERSGAVADERAERHELHDRKLVRAPAVLPIKGCCVDQLFPMLLKPWQRFLYTEAPMGSALVRRPF